MKTTIEISDPLFAQAKRFASARGLTLREVVEAGLRRVLQQPPSRAKPFRLRKVSVRGRGSVTDNWEAIRELIYEGRGGAPQ